MDCVCVPFRGWMGKIIDLSAFERGTVVGARRTGLCQELQCCWVFHAQHFPVCIKNGPPPKGHQVNLTQRSTWASITVERFRHLVECRLSPNWVQAQTYWGCSESKKGVQLNIRKVFLMWCTLSVCWAPSKCFPVRCIPFLHTFSVECYWVDCP